MRKFLVTIRSNGSIQHLRVLASSATEACITCMDRFPFDARIVVTPLT